MVICSAKTSDEYYKALNDHLNTQTSKFQERKSNFPRTISLILVDENQTTTNAKLQLVPQAYFRNYQHCIASRIIPVR